MQNNGFYRNLVKAFSSLINFLSIAICIRNMQSEVAEILSLQQALQLIEFIPPGVSHHARDHVFGPANIAMPEVNYLEPKQTSR